jgi:hypothetical protein
MNIYTLTFGNLMMSARYNRMYVFTELQPKCCSEWAPSGFLIRCCSALKLQNLVLEYKELFHAILLATYTIYPHIKFPVASSNSSLNIDIKIKINVDFPGQPFFIIHKNSASTSSAYVSKIYLRVTFHDSILLGGASVDPRHRRPLSTDRMEFRVIKVGRLQAA